MTSILITVCGLFQMLIVKNSDRLPLYNALSTMMSITLIYRYVELEEYEESPHDPYWWVIVWRTVLN